MIVRRTLGETLGDLADVAELVAAGSHRGLKVRSLAIELPLDLRMARGANGLVLVGDLPQCLIRTAFDPEPVRLAITLQAVPTAVEARR